MGFVCEPHVQSLKQWRRMLIVLGIRMEFHEITGAAEFLSLGFQDSGHVTGLMDRMKIPELF
jgi:hypothetical protein